MRSFFSSLRKIGGSLRGRRILLMLDFDGTITSFRREPSAVRLSGKMGNLLSGLARNPRVKVVVLSGRSPEYLRRRVPVKGILLVGEHGASMMRKGVRHKETASLAAALREFRKLASKFPGAWIERKRHGFCLHYRRASPKLRRELLRNAEKAFEGLPHNGYLRSMKGNMIFEVLAKNAWNKGDAVRALARKNPRRSVFMFGDDVTDEDAFRALGKTGFSVLVGKARRKSAARYSIKGIEGVAKALRWLLANA